MASVDAAARAQGLTPGMTVALAQAMSPGVVVVDADPDADASALERLAVWALRYTPIVAPDGPDGLVLDTAGADHLQGGEVALLADIVGRLRAAGIAARAALAETGAVAWGLARFGPAGCIAPVDRAWEAIAPLPVAALRLDPALAAALRRLGFDNVGELAAAHRPSLALRFGPTLTRRLDQARGTAHEAIEPVRPLDVPCAKLSFADPLTHGGGLALALGRLAEAMCADLQARGLAARRIDLVLRRVDGAAASLRVGASQGTRDPAHVVRLFGERLGAIDPGFGVEAMELAATRTEPFAARQLATRDAGETAEPDLGPLVDRIAARVGWRRLYRLAPVESDVPERCARAVPVLSPPTGMSWEDAPRPTVILDPPEPVDVIALLPDHPPRVFTWRGHRTTVARADGPERIHGEWWRKDAEVKGVRDYFRVEAEDGARLWMFRAGGATAEARWFVQGAFA